MAGLRIKHYAKTGLIRSVGAPPNGIVAVSFFNGAHFIVHPKAKPVESSSMLTVKVLKGSDPEEDGATSLTVEEVVEAALGCDRTIYVLWEAVNVALQNEVGNLGASFDVESVAAAVELAKDFRDQLAVNGWLRKR
jgi:hypothetical protein